ncbi:MAG: efflux RND transporter periplasmic adaptor subunit [Caulobacterales bacterium]
MNRVIAAAAILALAACGQKHDAETQAAQARAVDVARVEMRPIAGGLTASGLLTPREEVAVSADLAGYRVTRVLVEEGAWVSAGQPLAELDDSLLHAQWVQQVALAAQQREVADRADAEASRVKGLDGSGVLSQEQLDARRFSARGARAAATAQDAAAREMATRLAHMVVRAPFSGLVIERSVRPGDISGGSATPWFRLARDGQIELWADVAEQAFGQIHPGLPAKVTLADGAGADGTVRLVSPRVDSTTHLGRVRITLPVRANIRAGGFANATFIDTTRAVTSVPESAIRYDANGASLMVVGPDNRVSQIPIRTGQRGGGFVELVSGPPAGSRVVAKAAAQLLPGDIVQPVEAGSVAAR